MAASSIFLLLAGAVLALHVAIVAFVVAGLVLIVAGNRAGWRWVNALWFRALHLLTIAVVAAQAWLGVVCPLTTLEMWLRTQAGAGTYSGSFIEHWMQALLYWHAPDWVFALAYSAFALTVAFAWWRFPPAKAPRWMSSRRAVSHVVPRSRQNEPSSSGGKP
jgi:hypothetical protein